MMVIIHVVETLHRYLIRNYFQINTTHHSLKCFLEQMLSSPKKHNWVTMMLGYDYDIVYNKGLKNVVVDALYTQFE